MMLKDRMSGVEEDLGPNFNNFPAWPKDVQLKALVAASSMYFRRAAQPRGKASCWWARKTLGGRGESGLAVRLGA